MGKAVQSLDVGTLAGSGSLTQLERILGGALCGGLVHRSDNLSEGETIMKLYHYAVYNEDEERWRSRWFASKSTAQKCRGKDKREETDPQPGATDILETSITTTRVGIIKFLNIYAD